MTERRAAKPAGTGSTGVLAGNDLPARDPARKPAARRTAGRWKAARRDCGRLPLSTLILPERIMEDSQQEACQNADLKGYQKPKGRKTKGRTNLRSVPRPDPKNVFSRSASGLLPKPARPHPTWPGLSATSSVRPGRVKGEAVGFTRAGRLHPEGRTSLRITLRQGRIIPSSLRSLDPPPPIPAPAFQNRRPAWRAPFVLNTRLPMSLLFPAEKPL